MSVQIDAFLSAHSPRFICINCLAAVTSREEADVRATVQMLFAERRAETRVEKCPNCSVTAFVVRHRGQ